MCMYMSAHLYMCVLEMSTHLCVMCMCVCVCMYKGACLYVCMCVGKDDSASAQSHFTPPADTNNHQAESL